MFVCPALPCLALPCHAFLGSFFPRGCFFANASLHTYVSVNHRQACAEKQNSVIVLWFFFYAKGFACSCLSVSPVVEGGGEGANLEG